MQTFLSMFQLQSIFWESEDPIADRRANHTHAVKIKIQEILGIFGHFFVAIYTNDETQPLTFAQLYKAKFRLYDV